MTINEANALVEKCMSVILSCKTTDQLNTAIQYAGLCYRHLQKYIGLVNKTNFTGLIEQSIGFTQCKILNNI